MKGVYLEKIGGVLRLLSVHRASLVVRSVIPFSYFSMRALTNNVQESRERVPSQQNHNEHSNKPSLEWAHRQIDAAAARDGSIQGADYFKKLIDDLPELKKCVTEAHTLIGDNNPDQLTRFQQSQFADRLSTFTSGIASERLMKTRQEEESTKKYTQSGTPTGENYWMEAGNILASPSVPGLVKDQLLSDMQKERREDSPAFMEPKKEENLSKEEISYAEHVRQQKRRLLDGFDALF